MAVSLMPSVEIHDIPGQQLLHTLGERILPRPHQEMEVVRHQGPGIHDQAPVPAQNCEPVHKIVAICVPVEYLSSFDAPAHDMV